MTGFLQDLRYARRALARTCGFTLLACLILTLGIGASVTMFSIMHAVLWRALPYPGADQLIALETRFGPVTDAGLSPSEVLESCAKRVEAAVTYALEGYEGPRFPFWVELKRAARK
jgi:hypothetical protein